jgi:hypothetical protein
MPGSKSSDPGAAPLTLTGADPMALTVHDGPPPVLPVGVRRHRGRLTMFLVLLACAAPVMVSYFTYFVWRPGARNNYAELIQPTRTMPAALELLTLDGRHVPVVSLHGQWLLVVVAGGDCDARCETHLFEQRQIREMTGRERDRIDRVWLVTDDAPLRPPIAQAMQGGGGTPPATVLRVSREALAAWLAPEAGRALEDHLYLVDPMGEWMMRAPAAPEPKRLHKDLERLLRASSFWDRPGRAS